VFHYYFRRNFVEEKFKEIEVPIFCEIENEHYFLGTLHFQAFVMISTF
jgi:hypothetical protein